MKLNKKLSEINPKRLKVISGQRGHQGKWPPLLRSLRAGDGFILPTHRKGVTGGILMIANRLDIGITTEKVSNGYKITRVD